MESDIIKISHLNKSFGEVKAVNDLSFRVKKGELFAFLGVNGAGKSTTISILCGLLKKDSGTVQVNGIETDKAGAQTKRMLGVVFQDSVLDKPLTVKENLMSRAALYGITGNAFDKRLQELVEILDFDEFLNRPVGKLSGGQRRRIDIESWRKAWADMVNEEFQKKGMQERIDHRSYEAQGIMLIPQIHEGSNVRKMEAKGIRTEKGSLNRLIKEINQGILLLKEKVKDIMDVISELSEEMHRNEKSTKSDLSQCIQKYFADRNEMAESYSYGKNKARKTNLKKMAELLVYLEEHHISTIEELNEHVKGKKAELGILGQVNRRKKADIAGFKENLRYLNWYEEGIPIIGKIEKRKFNKAKERIKAENGDTLRRYHIAKRILTERELLGKMDKTTLQEASVPLWKRYALSIPEAAKYFGIGEKRLYQIIAENEGADFILEIGSHIKIKRELFGRFLDRATCV